MNKIYELLNSEIESKFDAMSQMEVGSEEYSKAIKDLDTLYKLRIDEYKVECDKEDKEEKRNTENENRKLELELKEKQLAYDIDARDNELNSKEKQLSDQMCIQYIRLGVEVAGIVLPLIFYASWMKKGFIFEETGTFTSGTFKNLFQKFKPSSN